MLISERNLDTLFISETWLLPFARDCFVHIPHFNMLGQNHGKGDGGVDKCQRSSQVFTNRYKYC